MSFYEGNTQRKMSGSRVEDHIKKIIIFMMLSANQTLDDVCLLDFFVLFNNVQEIFIGCYSVTGKT